MPISDLDQLVIISDDTGTSMNLSAGDSLTGKKGLLIFGVSGGVAAPLPISPTTTIGSLPTYNITQFGHVRTASPYVLLDSNFKYQIDTLEWETSVASGGVVSWASDAHAEVEVSGANGSRARLRSHRYFRYQSGKQHRVIETAYHGDTGQTNQVRRWGYFDDEDGLFFILSGTTFGVGVRNSSSGSPVDTVVTQASFNGTMPAFDITKSHIYEIAFQWLAVGNIQFWIDGSLIHTVINPNTVAGGYMRTGQLPMQFEIVNTGASVAAHYEIICTSVYSEGGEKPSGYTFSAKRSATKSIGTTEAPFLALRPLASYGTRPDVNRIFLLPEFARLSVATKAINWAIWIGTETNLTGASWVSADALSAAQYDVSATVFSATNARLITSGTVEAVPGEDQVDLNIFFDDKLMVLCTKAFATTGSTNQDVLIFTSFTDTATAAVRGSVTWREVR